MDLEEQSKNARREVVRLLFGFSEKVHELREEMELVREEAAKSAGATLKIGAPTGGPAKKARKEEPGNRSAVNRQQKKRKKAKGVVYDDEKDESD